MKKILSVLVVLALLLGCTAALAEETVTLKQAYCAPNGSGSVGIVTVALQGDKIVAVHIDELQWMDATSVSVLDAEGDLTKGFPEGKVLASKLVNNESYSGMMTAYAGSTVTIANNYAAIEAFCVGKTVAELEAAIAGLDNTTAVDAVSGATLVNTLGYLQSVLQAAKAN